MKQVKLFLKKSKWLQSAAVIVSLALVFILLTRNDCQATDQTCFNLVQHTMNGLLTGGIYALVALGIVIINKSSGVFNFAHGFLMLVGAMLFWQTYDATPSTELTLILAVIAGVLIYSIIVILSPVNLTLRGIKFAVAVDVTMTMILNPAKLTEISAETPPRTEKTSRLNRVLTFFTSSQAILGLIAGVITAGIIYQVFQHLNDDILRGALGALIGSIFIGLLVERFTIRPLLGQPILTIIMMTLAVSLVLQGLIALMWGTQERPLSIFSEPSQPMIYNGQVIGEIAGEALPNYEVDTENLLGDKLSFKRNLVWGFGIAISTFLGFVLFFQFTNIGLAMRAVSENQTLAESVGLRVRLILALAWAIAATMAMIVGVIQGTGGGGLSPIVITPLALRAFPAVLLGGLESITGALVGGLIIGVVEVLTTAYVDSTTGQELAPFLVMLVVLMIRPDGLFGLRRIERI